MFPRPEDSMRLSSTQGFSPHARVRSGSRTAAARPRRPWSPAARASRCFRVPPQAAAATPVVHAMATHLTRPAGRRKLARVTCECAYASN
jgi:hypothetical protein